MRQQGEIKTAAAEEALSSARSELEALMKELVEKSVTAGEAERRVKEIEYQLNDLKLSHSEELNEPVKQFSNLLQSVERYQVELFDHDAFKANINN